jgi:hypothetical protein
MILKVIFMAPLIGASVKFVLVTIGLPSWSNYAALLLLALVCYVTSCLLSGFYIEKRTPEFASNEEVFGDVQKWELTAGIGIVPKWVSWIGLMSFSCLLALFMPVVAPLFR